MPATAHEIDVALEKVTDEEIDFTVEALSGDLGDARYLVTSLSSATS